MDRAPIDAEILSRIANDLYRDGHVGAGSPSPGAVNQPTATQAAVSGADFAVGDGTNHVQNVPAGGATFSPNAPPNRPAFGRAVSPEPLSRVYAPGPEQSSGPGPEFGHVQQTLEFDPFSIPGFAPIPSFDRGFEISAVPQAVSLLYGAQSGLFGGLPSGGASNLDGLARTAGFADAGIDAPTSFQQAHLGPRSAQAVPVSPGAIPGYQAVSSPSAPQAVTPRSIGRPTPNAFAFTDAPHLGEFDEEEILRAALDPQNGAPSVDGLRDRSTAVPSPIDDQFAPSSKPSFYFIDDRMDYFANDVPTLPKPSAIPFNADAVRRDFPVLQQRVNGYPLVWLDNGATTQKPQAVIDRISHFYENDYSNISRSAHDLAVRATNAYEDARRSVQRFINASEFEEIVFVRGTTEGINLVAQSFGRRFIKEGDEILVTHGEHHANIVPWYNLAKEVGAHLRVAPFDDDGEIMLDEFERLLNHRVKIVATTHVANALGSVLPVKAMTEMAHRHGIPVLVDGAQSISHMPIDVQDIDCDFYVFSGHKLYAPTGIGALYGKKALLDQMPPWQGGGNMIKDVTFERITFQPPPLRFEAGTGNIADAVGLAEAIKYLERLGMTNIAQYEHTLLDYATHKLAPIKGLTIIGKAREKAGVISFLLDGKEPIEVGKALNEKGIAVRAGHHCALPILRRYGVEATVRPAFAMYNTFEDADRLAEAVRDIAAQR